MKELNQWIIIWQGGGGLVGGRKVKGDVLGFEREGCT